MISSSLIRFFAILLFLAFPLGANAAPDCNNWTEEFKFWKQAGPSDVARCLSEGADIEARGNGLPPLIMAIRSSTVRTVKALLDAGANIEARDRYLRWTPLRWATEGLREETVIALLDAGADPRARSKDGKTPLHVAAGSEKRAEAVKALLDAGADPNARMTMGGGGITPLHIVPTAEIAKILLDAGADPNARTDDGMLLPGEFQRAALINVCRIAAERGWLATEDRECSAGGLSRSNEDRLDSLSRVLNDAR